MARLRRIGWSVAITLVLGLAGPARPVLGEVLATTLPSALSRWFVHGVMHQAGQVTAVVGTIAERGPEHIAVRADETGQLVVFLMRGNPALIEQVRGLPDGARVEAVGHQEEGVLRLDQVIPLGEPQRGPAERPRFEGERPPPRDEPRPPEGAAAYQEDFEDGQAQGWELDKGWRLVRKPRGNRCLRGSGHTWARYAGGSWGDYKLALRLMLSRGTIHLNYRTSGHSRYFIGVHREGVYLAKQTGPETFFQNLARADLFLSPEEFVPIEIIGQGGRISVRVDGGLAFDYEDPDPLRQGGIAFETLDGSEAYIDGIVVTGDVAAGPAQTIDPGAGPITVPQVELPPDALVQAELVSVALAPRSELAPGRRALPPMVPRTDIQWAYRWHRTGGPFGGLGYDVRMVSGQKYDMYVSDAQAGVFRSATGGKTWEPANTNISVRKGKTNDGYPVFCVTIDPHDPNTIWVGTKDHRGVFKSINGGDSWVKMENGIQGTVGITVRGVTVHPDKSKKDTAFCSVEVSSITWNGSRKQGKLFDCTKGVVYKTVNGGKKWVPVWGMGTKFGGDMLARYILINPNNPQVMYISTGIFDREGANSTLTNHGGSGVWRSTDGGNTWKQCNTGLGNLYVGSLAMHPTDPKTMLAATGCNAWLQGAGVYLTTNGGDSWQQSVLDKNSGYEAFTSVEFGISDPKIAYAGSQAGIYRSTDGGKKFNKVTPHEFYWGPPGIRAGWPIDFQVDPSNAQKLFANAYGGGNFLSTNGGADWVDASKGYTGAQIRSLVVDPANSSHVWASARSGGFVSTNAGDDWTGLVRPQALGLDWSSIAIDPAGSTHLLAASLWAPGAIYESFDGGNTWKTIQVYNKPVLPKYPHATIGFRTLAFASNGSAVYGGTGGIASFGQLELSMPGMGIYLRKAGTGWQAANDTNSADAHVVQIAVHPGKPNIALAATYNKGLLRTDNFGSSWQTRNPKKVKNPKCLSIAINPADAQDLLLGLDHGGIQRSPDMGLNWNGFSAGIDPNASISSIVFDPTDPDVIYAADINSGVYRYDLDRKAWIKINYDLANREINALAISSDGTTLYAGSEGSGVFRCWLKSP